MPRMPRVLAVLPMLVACVVETTVPVDAACSSEGVVVALGRGAGPPSREFAPLRDGDEVVLTPGPQGAQHLWIDLRVRGIDHRYPRVRLRARAASDGRILGELRRRSVMTPSAEGAQVFSLPLIVENDRYCAVLPGDVRVEASVDDLAGHCGTAVRTARVIGIDPRASAAERETRERCCELHLLRCFPGDAPSDVSVNTAD